MGIRKLALTNTDSEDETTKPQALKVEKAAENVSSELDKVIHERMRLGIISALAANGTLSFTDLKNLLNRSVICLAFCGSSSMALAIEFNEL